MPEKTANPPKPATRRVRVAKPRRRPATPSHAEISERAYFIHLVDSGRDELENWLRAERELSAA